jgi:two-component system, response regulator
VDNRRVTIVRWELKEDVVHTFFALESESGIMNITIATNDPIIMVDDSEAEQRMVKHCYQKSVLQNPFLTFSEGPKFLVYMDSVLSKETPMPALVLLDLNMPVMDGIEVLKSIRQHQEFIHEPRIVILTNSDNPRDADRSMEMGATSFQIKPFHMADYTAFFNAFRE